MKHLAALLLALLVPPLLRAQPMAETFPPAKLPGESAALARRLAEVQKRAEQGEWTEVVEEYQRLLEEDGDALVPLDPLKPEHCVALRRLCHLRIAALPGAALRLYRERVDDQARKWLDQGIAQRDPVILRRLVEQSFCSRHADRALDLLGDLAFERGDFPEAERWWRLLTRPASAAGKPAELVLLFPDPQVEVAVVRAKQLLATLFRGDRPAALAEFKAFQTLHARAEGQLAGRSGNLADIVQAALSESGPIAPPRDDQTWPTFAGDPSRSRTFPQAPRCRWLDEPWRVPLRVGKTGNASGVYPVIAGDRVVVAGARSVKVYDLVNGRLLGSCDVHDDLKNAGFFADGSQGPADVDYTATVVGDRIYARLGGRAIIDPRAAIKGVGEAAEAKSDSFLVCLGLVPDRHGVLPCHWQVKAKQLDGEPAAFFEGAPLVRDGRVYIAKTRCNDPTAATAIECYDAGSGAPRWRQDICEARETRDGWARYRHHLLTAAGPNIVCCSQTGAVVAVDALNGKRVWAMRYPRRGEGSPRGLAPCVCADGRLFVAPADADRLFCLDVDSGRTFWESKPVEVQHLIGVAHGRIIFTTGAPPRGIRALDAATGRDLRDWVQPPDGSSDVKAAGRGLLAGDYVFWPTQHGLRVLNQEDGQPAADFFMPPVNAIKGNLAVGYGCLVVATPTELLGYVPESRLLEQRRKEAAEQPGAALPQYRLAVSLADAGQPDKAIEALTTAERLARPGDQCGSLLLRDCLRQQRWQLLLQRAEQAEARRRWDEAADHLTAAAAAAVPATSRWQARVKLAELYEKAGQPERAVVAWQTLLSDATLGRSLASAPPEYQPERRIAALIQKHGRPVYAKVEAQAEALLAAAPEASRDEARSRLATEFPNATVTVSAMREVARRPHPGYSVHRWLLRRARSEEEKAEALAGLARVYERRLELDCARDTWQQLARASGQRTIDDVDPFRPVSDFVTEQLKKPMYRDSHPLLLDLPLPLARAWQTPLDDERLLPQETSASDADFFFLLRGGRILTCRDAAGKLCWASDLDEPLTWVARRADLVIAAGPRCVCGLRLADGGLIWQFTATPPLTDAPLTAFQLVAGRLYFLEGERRLQVIDVETGSVVWNRAAPAALLQLPEAGCQFSPAYYVGRARVVIQTTAGRCHVLDSLTGRQLQEFQGGAEAWSRPPLALDDHRLVLVPDARQLALFDLDAGKEVWRRPLDRDASLSGVPPQVLGSGNVLLVLVARNFGLELQRLDPSSGLARWPKPLPLPDEFLDLTRAAIDAEAVYLPGDDLLRAVLLANGRQLWDCPLAGGDGPWTVHLTRRGLLVHPHAAETEIDAGHAFRRYRAADVSGLFPTLAPLPMGAAVATVLAVRQQALAPGRFPVLLCDTGDGRPIQRFNFATRGPSAGITLRTRGAFVVGGDTAWGVR